MSNNNFTGIIVKYTQFFLETLFSSIEHFSGLWDWLSIIESELDSENMFDSILVTLLLRWSYNSFKFMVVIVLLCCTILSACYVWQCHFTSVFIIKSSSTTDFVCFICWSIIWINVFPEVPFFHLPMWGRMLPYFLHTIAFLCFVPELMHTNYCNFNFHSNFIRQFGIYVCGYNIISIWIFMFCESSS